MRCQVADICDTVSCMNGIEKMSNFVYNISKDACKRVDKRKNTVGGEKHEDRCM